MAQKLRIVHLNATVAGGAFIAAERISNALNLLDGVESTHLVFEGQLPHNSKVNVLYRSWLERKQAFFFLEKRSLVRKRIEINDFLNHLLV